MLFLLTWPMICTGISVRGWSVLPTLHIPTPAFLCHRAEGMSAYFTNASGDSSLGNGNVLAPRDEGMGTIEGPPPLVITLLFCFAPFIIFIRISWSWRLGMARTCRMNRMSKKEITFNMKIPKHPHLCSFQRRTSLNSKPWWMREGTLSRVLWRGAWNLAESLWKA